MDEIDDRTKRALFRLEVIGPLVAARLSKGAARAARKQILARVYVWPDGTERKIGERTLRSWVKRHKEKGFAGLFDADPGTFGTCRALSSDVLNAAVQLRKEESSLSIPQIKDLLKSNEKLKTSEVENICPATLNRHLYRRGARKNKPNQQDGSFQRWEQRFVNDMWIGDTTDGIWIPDPSDPKRRKKTYLVSLIDGASRVLTHAQFYFDITLVSILDCFKKALLKRAKPERVYFDNAWTYRSTTMRLLCAELDIRPSFCTAKRPPGKGKIERQQRTAQEGFFNIAEHADIKTLDELNQFYFAWLTQKYHHAKHAELHGLTPMQRWREDKDRLVRVTPAQVRRGLMLRVQRMVNRQTATVQLNNVRYQAGIALAGEKVEVRFHFDDHSEIELWQRGKLIEIAKPAVVGPNIDFSRRLSKEDDDERRGKPYETFKAYKRAMVGNSSPEPSISGSGGELLARNEFLALFAALLARQLTGEETDFLEIFFHRHAPLNREAVRSILEQTIEVAGDRHHMRTYCDRILDTILISRRSKQ